VPGGEGPGKGRNPRLRNDAPGEHRGGVRAYRIRWEAGPLVEVFAGMLDTANRWFAHLIVEWSDSGSVSV